MNRSPANPGRPGADSGPPGVLDAAYDAFDAMLAVLRHHQEDDEAALPAFVLAASAAANGRDWIAEAPSLPAAPPGRHPGPPDVLRGARVAEVAHIVAAISRLLATRLTALAGTAEDPGDRASCEHAAAHAATIGNLLGGAGQT